MSSSTRRNRMGKVVEESMNHLSLPFSEAFLKGTNIILTMLVQLLPAIHVSTSQTTHFNFSHHIS